MNIYLHPEILAQQKYTCQCCGLGCRSFLVPVSAPERQAIEKLTDWRRQLAVDDLYVKTRHARSAGYGLARRPDGRCVFLTDDNLCAIHKAHGLRAKPIACQVFPFVFTPFAGKVRVGLRFDCTGVCKNLGEPLSTYKKQLRQLAQHVVPAAALDAPAPPLLPGVHLPEPWLDAINETLVSMINSNALSFAGRLHWMRKFLNHLHNIKWKNVTEEDFPELLSMLRGSLLAEVTREESPPSHPHEPPTAQPPPAGKPRKLLGQIFFLLSHPPELLGAQGKPFLQRLRERTASTRDMRRLGHTSGPLPKVRPHWPDADLADLEHTFGSWPADLDQMLTRYLTCRIASLGYCGRNFYDYSLVEGARTLLLALVTLGWLMRIEAVTHARSHLELPDAQNAVMTIDGNLGYGRALATGPSRMRLDYLSNHLKPFINAYCR